MRLQIYANIFTKTSPNAFLPFFYEDKTQQRFKGFIINIWQQ